MWCSIPNVGTPVMNKLKMSVEKDSEWPSLDES
jgi:hypothetical protein